MLVILNNNNDEFSMITTIFDNTNPIPPAMYLFLVKRDIRFEVF